MPPAPLAVSLLLGGSATAAIVGLAFDSEPFSSIAASLFALGGGLLTLITVAGLLLARGRWARWMALGLGVVWFGEAVAGPFDIASIATMVLATATATAAAGPWLQRWVRHLPAADGPPPAAATLLVSLVATPVALALFEPRGSVGAAGWLLVAWSLLLALGVARALAPALWAARIAHPVVAIAIGVVLGMPAAAGVIAKAAVETALVWRRDVHLAVTPLIPRPSAAVPIPPELVDPAIMKAAGLNDRGRPLEDS